MLTAGIIFAVTLLCSRQGAEATTPQESSCSPPTVHGCSVAFLTAPLYGSFSTYCMVEDPADAEVRANWTRLSGSLDANRTTISHNGTSSRNVSITIQGLQETDEDAYILTASSRCGVKKYSVSLLVKRGGCQSYQAPNATHITSNSTEISEGDAFSIRCNFNGDTQPSHYNITWFKDSGDDRLSGNKFHKLRTTGCPLHAPCCSFTDTLEVSSATVNDSGLYTCAAQPVGRGAKGTPLSLHIVVKPRPSPGGRFEDFVVSASVGVAVISAAVVMVIMCTVCLRVRWKRRSGTPHYLLVNEDGSSYYGSMTVSQSIGAYSSSVAPNPVHHATPGKPPVFLLYGLELETFSVKHEDCPAYNLVLDFARFMESANVRCYHDGFSSFSAEALDFSSRVESALREVKLVVVICSEVLYTAFTETPCDKAMVQMKYGRFSAQSVLKVMQRSPEKFVPVFLAGRSPVCEALQGQRSFDLQNFELFMEHMKEGTHLRTEVLQQHEFTTLREYLDHLYKLLK